MAAERVRYGDESQPGEIAGRDPEELAAESQELRAREREFALHLGDVRRGLDEALARRRAAESAHLDEDRRIAGLLRAVADSREGLARLSVRSIRCEAVRPPPTTRSRGWRQPERRP